MLSNFHSSSYFFFKHSLAMWNLRMHLTRKDDTKQKQNHAHVENAAVKVFVVFAGIGKDE